MSKTSGLQMLMAGLIIGVLCLCLVVVLYFLGLFGDLDVPLPKGLVPGTHGDEEDGEGKTQGKGTPEGTGPQKTLPSSRVGDHIVIQMLSQLAKAQEAHHRQHSRYSLSLRALSGFSGVDPSAARATTPMSPYHGYYFLVMEMYETRPVDPKTEFVITALPAKYGDLTRLSYALDRSGIVRSKDLGGSLVRSATDIDSTWTPVR